MRGNAGGGLVVGAVSERLNASIGEEGIVARLSGDEFAIAIPCAEMPETITELSERIGLAFNTPLLAGTRQHRVKVSIGAATYPDGGRTANDLFRTTNSAFGRAERPSP